MKNTIKVSGFAAIIAAIALNALLLTGCPPEPEGPTVESIAITKNPDKMQYTVGEKFDPTGMVVTATYSDGTKKEVTGYTVSGSFSDDGAFKTPGPNGVTISFGGKNAFVNNINVTRAISSIAVTTQPTKTTYTVGEDLVITGLVVTATFSDNSTGPVAVTAADISGYDKTKTGSQTLTVTFGGKTATFTVTVNPAAPPADYVITGSGTTFTAKKGDAAVGTAGAIQAVIDAIRTDANGGDKTIQLGDGTAVLDIGSSLANFSGTWGKITLTGKITSTGGNGGTITIPSSSTIDLTSRAEIANTGTSATSIALSNSSTSTVNISGGTVTKVGNNGYAVANYSTGTINISGGTVSATGSGQVVRNNDTGTINISGGTVSATTGIAVYSSKPEAVITISGGTVSATTGIAVNFNGGKVIVSGTAKITSANGNTSSSQGTIVVDTSLGTIGGGIANLEIKGGTVENTAATGCTISYSNTGVTTISGGKVTSATTSTNRGTIYLAPPSTLFSAPPDNTDLRLNITGGTVENTAAGGYAIYNTSAGAVTVGTGATITGQQKLTK